MSRFETPRLASAELNEIGRFTVRESRKGTEFYRKIMELHEEFISRTLSFMDHSDMVVLKDLLGKIEEHLLSSTQLLDETTQRSVR